MSSGVMNHWFRSRDSGHSSREKGSMKCFSETRHRRVVSSESVAMFLYLFQQNALPVHAVTGHYHQQLVSGLDDPALVQLLQVYDVVAADDMDIKKARAVMLNKEDFMRAAEEEEIRLNPGKGDLVVRFIMKRASTTQEVQSLYDNFKKAPNRTSEIDVFAAYSVKMQRFLTGPGADEELEQEWWRNKFDTEVDAIVGNEGELTLIISKLEEEYPENEG